MEENNNQGNPKAVNDAVFGSDGDDFFDRMENEVNGAIKDNVNEVTPPTESGSEQVTHDNTVEGSNNLDWESDDNPYKKRYADSSKEGIKQREMNKEVEPFIPLLNAMKQDSGLVDHVRDYLTTGGKPSKTLQEKLGLDEDFVYDANEAMQDDKSDSARLLNSHVDAMVRKRVAEMTQAERNRAIKAQMATKRQQEEAEFRTKHNMTDEQYNEFLAKAREHKLTLEDVNYLINRDKVASNTANATKEDMLNQMKNVRDIPTSLSGANNQDSKSQSQEDNIFNTLKDLDGDLDNLFG